MNQIKDLLQQLLNRVDEIEAQDEFNESDLDGQAIVDEIDTLILRANSGYSEHVNVLCHLQDTGNGYIAFLRS